MTRKLSNFFTGLPDSAVFNWLLALVKWKIKYKCKNLAGDDQLFLVLMKIKLGLLNKDLAYRFIITECIVSKIYRNWVPTLSKEGRSLIIWPEKAALRKNVFSEI